MNLFVFDIETVPDLETGRRILGLEEMPDRMVLDAMMSLTKEATGQTFVKQHLHKIVALSAVFRHKETLKVWSLGELDASESEIITRFFQGIEKYKPTLVSWNGGAFDLPVLHYRALYHGIVAKTYWDHGEQDSSFKYNNYLSRYHTRHLDLMDVLAGFQPRAFARLDDIAQLLGLPGKMGMDGTQVADAYFDGKLEDIRNYCETDVLNTYLIYLRFELIKGGVSPQTYDSEVARVKDLLTEATAPHLQSFLNAWNKKKYHVQT